MQTPSRLGRDEGLGLVELLVALTILAFVLSAVAYGLTQQLAIGLDSRQREVAANLAAEEIDEARATPDFALIQGREFTTAPINDQTYTVLRTVTTYLGGGAASACEGGSTSSVSYKRVSVRVTWPDMGGTEPVRSDTLIAPGSQNYDPLLGNIAVTVTAASGAGAEGILVTAVRGATTRTQYTDEQGCAFIDGVAAGSYTVSASRSGYVNQAGVPAPPKPATPAAGTTVAVSFDLDAAARITASLPTGTYPAIDNVTVSLGNSGLPVNGIRTFTGSGNPRALADLFPFPTGYRIWAGTCSDADPAGAFPTVIVPPGGSTTADVPMAAVAATVFRSDGVTPVPSVQVTATHVPDADAEGALCPASTTQPSHVLGLTDSVGAVSRSMPFGTWQFSAPGATSVQATLTPGPDPIPVALEIP